MRSLVTGGAGFIGSNLVDELIRDLQSKCGETYIEIMEGDEEKVEFKLPKKVKI